MPKEINITIENKLVIEERDMNVYHHASKSAHMISHNSSITLPLKPDVENDYLYISTVSGPGHMENKCQVSLPSWLDFQLQSSNGNLTVTRSGNRTLVKMPPGLPGWELKLTRSTFLFNKRADSVTVSEAPQALR
ncbi:MAG: hypothetical protein GY757_26230 [bacterium]|nr:hypothetical protein [bacterium]